MSVASVPILLVEIFYFWNLPFAIKISWLIHTHYQNIRIIPTFTCNTLTHTVHYIQAINTNTYPFLPPTPPYQNCPFPFLAQRESISITNYINFYSTGFLQSHFSKCSFSLSFICYFLFNSFKCFNVMF